MGRTAAGDGRRRCAREGCTNTLTGKIAKAQYCSDQCRNLAFRQRRDAPAEPLLAAVAATGGAAPPWNADPHDIDVEHPGVMPGDYRFEGLLTGP